MDGLTHSELCPLTISNQENASQANLLAMIPQLSALDPNDPGCLKLTAEANCDT